MHEAEDLAEEDRSLFASIRAQERWPSAMAERSVLELHEQRRTLDWLLGAAQVQHGGHPEFGRLRDSIDRGRQLQIESDIEYGTQLAEIVAFARRGLTIDIHIDQNDDLVFTDQEALVVRLLLVNALRNCEIHGGATEARVRLRHRSRWITLEVVDNGCGVTAGIQLEPHHGLGRVSSLLALINGRLSLLATPPGATTRAVWERAR